MKKLLLLLLLSLGLSLSSYASESNYSSEGKKTLYDQKGSNSGPTMSGYNNYLSPWTYAFEIVEKPHPVRYGSTSERYELREGDCGNVSGFSDCEENLARSEIVLDTLLIQARYNQDIWYGWSFYNETIPTIGLYNIIGQWKNGVKNQNDDILQIRQTPQDSFNPIMWENCDSTFCSNHLETKDSYDVTVNLGHGGRYKYKGNANNWNMPCRLWSMEENKGKWVDIVINTNFGSNDDGYVNIWIDGEKRCEYQGVLQDYVPRFPGHNQTAISGESEYPGPSHKRGIFINKNRMTKKTHPTLIAYYDEFRVGKSRKEVDIRMIEDPNYEPPQDKCAKGFTYKNNRCTLDTVEISNKYDGQYTMYLYRSYPDRNDKNIIKKSTAESIVITVGDRTTENILQLGLKPQIQIIDCLEKRNQRTAPIDDTVNTKLSCRNPPGEITEESIQVIKKAFSSEPPVRIVVNGEEDLLVIPVCILAPENSVVMYGQPNEGLVIVQITPKIRAKVQKILDAMN